MDVLTPEDYNQSDRKRPRRSARPCDQCKRRKTRCVTDAGDANCAHCKLRGTDCSFRQKSLERSSAANTRSGSGRDSQLSVEQSTPVATSMSTGMLSAHEASLRGPSGMPECQERDTRDHVQPQSAGNPELGLAKGHFAELYGLGSDMEPLLMVCASSHPVSMTAADD